MKRLVSLVLSLILCCSVLPMGASAYGHHPFTDVPDDHWASYGVQYVYDNGLMNGTSSTTFSPDSKFSRAMFVTILGRMEGVDPADYRGTPFSDVNGVAWAKPYIQWASEMGIVNGVGGGKFAPNDPITREQYCTIVVRYMDNTGKDFLGDPQIIPTYPDVDDISTYAVTAFIEMASYGLIDDFEGDALPKIHMTRADIADLFSRFHEFMETGYMPYVYNVRQDPYIGYNEVAEILADTSSFTWDWMHNNSYTDPGKTLTAYDPAREDWATMEKVIYPWVEDAKDVKKRALQHYTAGAWDELSYYHFWYKAPDGLYVPKVDSGDGYFSGIKGYDLDVEQASETEFYLTIMPYDSQGSMGIFYNTLIYKNGYWVFEQSVPPLLDTVPMAFG